MKFYLLLTILFVVNLPPIYLFDNSEYFKLSNKSNGQINSLGDKCFCKVSYFKGIKDYKLKFN